MEDFMKLFSKKQNTYLDQEVRISICLPKECEIEMILKDIRAEKNVLSIQKMGLDNWYSIQTMLPVESANRFAGYLKDKYHLEESYYDKPFEIEKRNFSRC